MDGAGSGPRRWRRQAQQAWATLRQQVRGGWTRADVDRRWAQWTQGLRPRLEAVRTSAARLGRRVGPRLHRDAARLWEQVLTRGRPALARIRAAVADSWAHGAAEIRRQAPRARGRLAAVARVFRRRGWRAGIAVASSALGLALLALALSTTPSPRLQPAPQLPEVIGFYQNGWSRIFRSSFASLRAHYRYIDTVLAFWYSVGGDGHLHAHSPNPAVTAWVRAHHMRMGVLINNIPGASGDSAGMLRSSTVRHRAAQAIATLVRRDRYQDVNIDFELLPRDVRADFTRFVADVRRALPASVVLSVSVFPKLGVPPSLNGAYDYAALARSADYLVVMLYDRHSSGGPAGPVSPYPWVVDNMDWFLHTARIAPNRLVLAAGVYGYDWPVGSTAAKELPLDAITALAKREHARVEIDRASANPFFRYTSASGQRHIVWFQNDQTVEQRLHLAERLHLHGIAIWALGQETPAVWSVIEQTLAPRS